MLQTSESVWIIYSTQRFICRRQRGLLRAPVSPPAATSLGDGVDAVSSLRATLARRGINVTPAVHGLLTLVRDGLLQRHALTAEVALRRVAGLASVGREVLRFDVELVE